MLTRLLLVLALTAPGLAQVPTRPDSWAATDGLGRELPTAAQCGAPRERFVAMFYFLWLNHDWRNGPFDVSRILAANPGAMRTPTVPPWGPLQAAHHWGEPLFGYYTLDDDWVLRKHAQMLADAGVDTLVFDVTNQLTYPTQYRRLLDVFAQVRADGGRTPQVAFLTPFWDPAKVVGTLWRDLYSQNIHPELWFRWEGKPLLLADRSRLGRSAGHEAHDTPARLEPGHRLGQSFTLTAACDSVAASCPTWREQGSALTLTLYRDSPAGERLASLRHPDVSDNAWLTLPCVPALAPGRYYLEASEPHGVIGWWTDSRGPDGGAWADGQRVGGQRTLRLGLREAGRDAMLDFFCFRRPQPSYFEGPTGPDQWSWLEVHPQKVYRNRRGEKEMMSVGVAQNAVGGRLGSMSEQHSRGRSYHDGALDPAPDAVRRGLNFAEQTTRALSEDPRLVFITGWNEWIAGRFKEFAGVKEPVMFVDEFDQEHSRDLEPARARIGDDYYHQLLAFVRRYKGVAPVEPASAPRTIELGAGFDQWADVRPEFTDDAGDTLHRDADAWNHTARYTNATGRHDFVALKVARDDDRLYFYARCREPLTPCGDDPRWMVLLLRTGGAPGWLGFDYRVVLGSRLEHSDGGWNWQPRATVASRVAGRELMLSIPRAALGLAAGAGFDFKWLDNVRCESDPLALWVDGDTAPNGRARYRFAP